MYIENKDDFEPSECYNKNGEISWDLFKNVRDAVLENSETEFLRSTWWLPTPCFFSFTGVGGEYLEE